MARFALVVLHTMRVRDLMQGGVHTVQTGDPLATALRTMRDVEVGVLLVLDGRGTRVGVLSRTDLLEHIADLGSLDAAVGSIASREVLTVGADEPIASAIRAMAQDGVHHVVVLDRDEAVGVLGAWDLVRAAADGLISLEKGPSRAVGARSGPGV